MLFVSFGEVRRLTLAVTIVDLFKRKKIFFSGQSQMKLTSLLDSLPAGGI